MKTFFYKNFKFSLVLLVIISLSISTSCNKDDSKKISSDKSSTLQKNYLGTKEISHGVYSLFLDKDATNYIDLNAGKLVTENDHWDIKMSGMYASSINANTAFNGILNFIDEEYKDVDAFKVVQKFGTNSEEFHKNFINLKDFGMDHLVGDELGWAWYDMSSHLVHPLTYRTLLLKTPKADDPGKLAFLKIQITSMYEGNILLPQPEDKHKVPYLTARFQEIKELSEN